jgi:D-tyrosyl-tRNA(Tyr) deacylase
MRALIQRVTNATVENLELNETSSFAIERGYVVLLGIGHNDTELEAQKLWNKIAKLRIFDDETGKTNLSLRDVGGSVLVVSQFTLYASCKKGNRPSFTDAAAPKHAEQLYQYFIELVKADGVPLEHGWFGAHMQIALVNDGPFTIWLDTTDL